MSGKPINDQQIDIYMSLRNQGKLQVGKTLPSFDFDLTPDLGPNKINALAENRDWVSQTVTFCFLVQAGWERPTLPWPLHMH